jgi:hypothetical protein
MLGTWQIVPQSIAQTSTSSSSCSTYASSEYCSCTTCALGAPSYITLHPRALREWPAVKQPMRRSRVCFVTRNIRFGVFPSTEGPTGTLTRKPVPIELSTPHVHAGPHHALDFCACHNAVQASVPSHQTIQRSVAKSAWSKGYHGLLSRIATGRLNGLM